MERSAWPVYHILEDTALHFEILYMILRGKELAYSRAKYSPASPKSVVSDDLYTAIAAVLSKRNFISNDLVVRADDSILEQVGKALSCSPEFVGV